MINNTTLVGRLTKNPELKYTGSGIAVTNFTMAVERNFTNAQGEKETDYINCVAWRKTAEALAQFAVRGSLIGVTGSIQTRNYQNNEGQTVYITEILADNFRMLEPKSVTDERRNQGGGQGSYRSKPAQTTNKNPFADVNYSDVNPFESGDTTDIHDDDLPF